MVRRGREHSEHKPAIQAATRSTPAPNDIRGSTPFDFTAKNQTPYGGLLPVATMLEKLDVRGLIEERLTISRVPRVMSAYQFVLAVVLGRYLGIARLHQLRFVARDPILTGILKVRHVPPQPTLWRFLDSLQGAVARQILSVQTTLRERVWAAGHVRLTTVTLDCPRYRHDGAHGPWAEDGNAHRVTTRSTRGRRAISRSSRSWPRRGSTCGASCTTGTGRTASRLRRISRTSSKRCRPPSGDRLVRIRDSIVGRPWRPTRRQRADS